LNFGGLHFDQKGSKREAGISCPKHHHNQPQKENHCWGLIFFGDAPRPRIPMDSHDNAWGSRSRGTRSLTRSSKRREPWN
jgi:hypothetical protein